MPPFGVCKSIADKTSSASKRGLLSDCSENYSQRSELIFELDDTFFVNAAESSTQMEEARSVFERMKRTGMLQSLLRDYLFNVPDSNFIVLGIVRHEAWQGDTGLFLSGTRSGFNHISDLGGVTPSSPYLGLH